MKRVMLAGIAAAAVSLAFAAPAMADFTVNSTGDAADATPDGICDTGAGPGVVCTLRAAMTEADVTVAPDTITFSPIFNGSLGATISIASPLPNAFNPLTISGGDCDPSATAARPCVGIDAAVGASFSLNLGSTTAVSGIAFSSSNASNTPILVGLGTATIRNNWLGLRVDGTADTGTCNIGVAVEGGTSSTIGGTNPQQRNVFSNCLTGLELKTNSNVVQGNYFGTTPSGTIGAGLQNSRDIDLEGFTGVPATNNVIGGADAGTPGVCDGACNLIAHGANEGIRVGVNVNQAADNTDIKGNFIGLGLDGTSDLGNLFGILANYGSGLTVGGPSTADRNFIAGNDGGAFDVAPSPNVSSVTLQNDYIGVNATGSARVGDSAGPNIQSASAQILGNVVGDRLLLQAPNMVVQGNSIGIGTGGQDVGDSLSPAIYVLNVGSTTIGGATAGQGNQIGNFDTGLLLTNSNSNIIKGNAIGTDFAGNPQPVSGKGILLSGDDNQIGGAFNEAASTENVITSSGDDAIAIILVGSTGNAVYRDRGSAGPTTGQDLFLDLGDDGPGNPTNVNNGATPLTIASANSTVITGSALDNPNSGDTLVAYKTTDNTGRDIRSYITSILEPDNVPGWSIPTAPMPAGQCVTVGQIDSGGFTYASSELSNTVAVGGGACDVTGPTVTITPPAGPITSTSPSFSFTASEAGSTFECRFDAGAFASCTSPKTPAAPLSIGAHTFDVRATDPVGNLGPVASAPFTITAPTPPGPVVTGKRAAALKKCKKKKTAAARKKCKKKAKKLPL